mmetsp:Transcript_14606/g.42715  ORF Transcript_14606/g.42715 Transcript_14606/m.42715 type:complete len:214 (-) Transcript_14606:1352-1993(-)
MHGLLVPTWASHAHGLPCGRVHGQPKLALGRMRRQWQRLAGTRTAARIAIAGSNAAAAMPIDDGAAASRDTERCRAIGCRRQVGLRALHLDAGVWARSKYRLVALVRPTRGMNAGLVTGTTHACTGYSGGSRTRTLDSATRHLQAALTVTRAMPSAPAMAASTSTAGAGAAALLPNCFLTCSLLVAVTFTTALRLLVVVVVVVMVVMMVLVHC